MALEQYNKILMALKMALKKHYICFHLLLPMNKFLTRMKELFYIPENEWKEVDRLIYGMDDYFLYSRVEAEEIRNRAIKEAFHHHYNNNLFYHNYCKDNGVSPDDIKGEEDFSKIPMLPDTFFKDYPGEEPRKLYEWLYTVSSIDIGDYDFRGKSLNEFFSWAEKKLNGLVTHSSGTTGKFSFMFRDVVTRKRNFYAADKVLLFSIFPPDDNTHVIYPGPVKTYLTMGRWVAEGTKVADDDHRHFLTDKELTMDVIKIMAGQINGIKDKMKLLVIQKAMKKGQMKLLHLLEELDKKGEQMYMITFPFQLYDLMNIMKEEGVYLDMGRSNSVIITGGGWKIHEGMKISPSEMASMVKEYFGIGEENYRDVYGMSEMNGLALECEARYKHIPPWIYPMVLDENYEPVGYGEEGRFAFLDPAANSYPGFIITGDKVKLLESCPECGREGVVIDGEITRMRGAEAKGCGNLMRELMVESMR